MTISRRLFLAIASSGLVVGCAGDPGPGPPQTVVYDTWLYDSEYRYDDEFSHWLDEQDDEEIDRDDIRQAFDEWYDGLAPADQEAVRQRVDDWLEAHDLEPVGEADQRQLIADTVSDRWTAMSPEERQTWLDTRRDRAVARDPGASPEARASAQDRLAGIDRETLRSRPNTWSLGRTADREAGAFGGLAAHPQPARDGMRSGNVGFSRSGGGRHQPPGSRRCDVATLAGCA
jgi:hypothetical protein